MNFIESTRIKIIIHVSHMHTCLAMQRLATQCPAAQRRCYFVYKMYTLCIKLCKRSVHAQSSDCMKWQKTRSLLSGCCYLKSHLSYMWAANCWREFYLELGFHFMTFYILLSHIISNTLSKNSVVVMPVRVRLCVLGVGFFRFLLF